MREVELSGSHNAHYEKLGLVVSSRHVVSSRREDSSSLTEGESQLSYPSLKRTERLDYREEEAW